MTEKNENFDLSELKKDSLEIDELFHKFPAPLPSPALVDDIKRRIAINRRRFSIPKLIIKTAAVAAIIALAWTFVFDDLVTKYSNENVFSKTDQTINEFEKEINSLRSEFYSVSLNEDTANEILSDTITSVEAQIIETDTSFWKG